MTIKDACSEIFTDMVTLYLVCKQFDQTMFILLTVSTLSIL